MDMTIPAWATDLAAQLSVPVDIYCERTSDTYGSEPLNAISNAAFPIAAWMAWRLEARRPNPAMKNWVAVLCAIIAVVGVGSFIFHTAATVLAEWADVIPILVFMIVYGWTILTYLLGWPVWLRLTILAIYFAATFDLESANFDYILWGGAMYLPTLVLLSAAGIVLLWRDPKAGEWMFAAAGLFILSFVARTIDMPLCPSWPTGTHFMWHILNATVLYVLVRTIVLRAPTGRAAARHAAAS